MKRAGILGLFVLICLLVLVGYAAISTKDFVERYVRGASGTVVTGAVGATIESIKNLYTSFQQTMDIVMNPWKYMYEVEEAKPSDEVIREQYGVFISPLSQLSYAIFKCKNKDCNDVIIPSVYLISYINYNFPKKRKIEFSCNISTTYDECFSKKSCKVSKKVIEGKEGVLAQQINITLEFNKDLAECHDCPTFSDLETCIEKPVIFKDYGFRVTVTLKANFSVEANTTFRSLITTDTILAEAISRKKSIYDILGIDSTKYDIAYYTGLLGFPHVDVSRLGKKHNYPIILFGDDIESYDVLLFGVQLNNIKSINDLKLYIFTSSGIDLGYLNLEDGKCKDKYRYEVVFEGSDVLFSINCTEKYTKMYDSTKGEEHICYINITREFMNMYKKNYGDTLKFIIPICLKEKGTFIGDYGELLVQAHINYTYETFVSSEVSYIPFDIEI